MPSEGWKLTVGPKPGCTLGSFLEIRKPLGGYCTANLRLQALAIGWDERCLLGAFGARLTAKGCSGRVQAASIPDLWAPYFSHGRAFG